MEKESNTRPISNLSHTKSYYLLLALMLAGIIPFLILTLLAYTNLLSQSRLLELLFTYSAVILSFLGGIQWGIGIIRLEEKTLFSGHIFSLSVLPSLIAWFLLLLHSSKLQLIGFILSFMAVFVIDMILTRAKVMPKWFLKLRFIITLAVITLLLLNYFAL